MTEGRGQVLIAGPAFDGGGVDVGTDRFAVETHGRTHERVLETIDALGATWDAVIDRLTHLAESAHRAAGRSPFQLDSIEFSIGVEAGLNVWLVTKGEASVCLTFTRRPDREPGAGAPTTSG